MKQRVTEEGRKINEEALVKAREKLGLPKGSLGVKELSKLICLKMKRSNPTGKLKKYKLIREFCGMTTNVLIERLVTRKAASVSKTVVKQHFNATNAFLETYAWRKLRMEILKENKARCMCCGMSPKDGIKLHVDHIKPRKVYPELALDKTNLQILCEVCNHGKGNWDETDWRSLPTHTH